MGKVKNSKIKVKGIEDKNSYQHVCIAISAAVTVYGRIHINKKRYIRIRW